MGGRGLEGGEEVVGKAVQREVERVGSGGGGEWRRGGWLGGG